MNRKCQDDRTKKAPADPSTAFRTEDNGKIFEAGAGWYGLMRWQRSKGAVFKTDETFTPAAVRLPPYSSEDNLLTATPFRLFQVKARWAEINDFKNATYPENITDTDYLVSCLCLELTMYWLIVHPFIAHPVLP